MVKGRGPPRQRTTWQREQSFEEYKAGPDAILLTGDIT